MHKRTVREVNDKHNFFFFFIKWHQEKRNDSSNCQWNPGGMLQLQWTGLRAPSVPETITHWSHGLHHGNEISKMDGNSIVSFVLTEHRSDLSVLLLQIWQWLLISSRIAAITVQAVDDMCFCRGHLGVNNAMTADTAGLHVSHTVELDRRLAAMLWKLIGSWMVTICCLSLQSGQSRAPITINLFTRFPRTVLNFYKSSI